VNEGQKCDKCGCSELDKPNVLGITRFDITRAFAKVFEGESKHWEKSFFELRETLRTLVKEKDKK
jgi:hypothetical protein